MPSGSISPSSSAIGTNVTGETGSPLRLHRTSDSKPDAHPRGQRHDRLVVHLEVVGGNRAPQIVLEAQAVAHARVHVGVEHLVPRLAARLGVIHGGVGVAHDLVGVGVVRGAERDPDARRREHFAAGDRERRAQRILDPAGDGVGLRVVVQAVQEDRELVSAQPRQRVALPQARLQAPRRRDQQLVADHVAETVVDDLEAVQIEIEHGEAAAETAAPALVEPPPEPLDEHGAVGEPGQRIEEADAAEPLLRDRLLGRVGERPGNPVGLAPARLAPPRRGRGTGGRRRPRGGYGARAGRPGVEPARCASSAALRLATSSGWTRSSHSPGPPIAAWAGRPIIARQRPET